MDSTSVFTDGWFQANTPPGTPIESVIVLSFGWFEGGLVIIIREIPRPAVMAGSFWIF